MLNLSVLFLLTRKWSFEIRSPRREEENDAISFREFSKVQRVSLFRTSRHRASERDNKDSHWNRGEPERRVLGDNNPRECAPRRPEVNESLKTGGWILGM